MFSVTLGLGDAKVNDVEVFPDLPKPSKALAAGVALVVLLLEVDSFDVGPKVFEGLVAKGCICGPSS